MLTMTGPVTTDGPVSVVLFVMNVFYDANAIYEAGSKAMKGSPFKYGTQLFEMNHLLRTAEIQRDLMNGTYQPAPGQKFIIRERGKTRYITSNSMVDKTVNHLLCDDVLTPAIKPYLIYDNGASQKGKGVSFHRKRFEAHLHKYYNTYGTNEGYALLVDFSGYYANIPHDRCIEVLRTFLEKELEDPVEVQVAMELIRRIFKTFEMDVSRFSDAEIEEMYRSKVDPLMNVAIPPEALTGEKMLRKGVDIGSQTSQDIGLIYPHRIDNYVKIIRGVKNYGRYTDDFYIFHPDKTYLRDILNGIRQIADEYGLIINERKTRIVKLSRPFRHLQICYALTDTGRVIRKINPKSITRERRKLKKYKKKLDAGTLTYEDIENSFKSWIGAHWRLMSMQQIANMADLYYQLYGRRPQWKRGHSRLRWLMGRSSKTSASTATTTSARTS